MENPHISNPSAGFIVVCGNRISPPRFKIGVGASQPTTARAKRINELLKSLPPHARTINISSVKAFQADTVDPYAKILLPLLVAVTKMNMTEYFPLESAERNIVTDLGKKLANFSGEMGTGDFRAAFYTQWMEELADTMLQKTFPALAERSYIMNMPEMEHFLGTLLKRWSKGFDISSDFCKTEANKHLKTGHCLYNAVMSMLSANKKFIAKFGNAEVGYYISPADLIFCGRKESNDKHFLIINSLERVESAFSCHE